MRFVLGISISLLATACSGPGGSMGAGARPRRTGTVEQAFELWRQAALEGDYAIIHEMFSPRMRAQALRDAYRDEFERGVLPRMGMLSTDEIAALRAWWEINRASDRPDVLPDPLTKGPWLRQVLEHDFRAHHDQLRDFLSGAQVVRASSDGVNGTVLVRRRSGAEDAYYFVRQADSWILDHILLGPSR